MGLFTTAFSQAQQAQTGPKLLGGVPASPEFDRVWGLPRRVLDLSAPEWQPGGAQDLTPLFQTPGGAMSLRPVQNATLWEASMCDGAFVAAGVGEGKSLISLLLPDVMESERAVLLVGADLRDKLFEQDIPFYGRHFKLPLDRLTVFTYHDLSDARFLDALDSVNPDLIIADEAHRLRHKSAARSRRWTEFMRTHPGTRFVPLSGSFTTRSILDYAHLLKWALGPRCPLPTDHPTLTDWALAIDPQRPGQPMNTPGALAGFCAVGENVRQGYQRRFADTPGVIVTVKSSVAGTSLYLRQRHPAGGVPAVVQKALDDLNTTWEIGGQELMEAMHVARYARQLACGFYYRWRWSTGLLPTPQEQVWLNANHSWSRAVRAFLTHNAVKGLDSPMLLWDACARGKPPNEDLWVAFNAWVVIKPMYDPRAETVWLDDFMIRDAVDWADTVKALGKTGIIWYQHDAVGDALYRRGFPWYGAGADAGTSDPMLEPIIVCSIRAQGEGKNLQNRSMNYVSSPPSNGPSWEQMLGRTHRPGQQEDEVWVDVPLHTPENVDAIRQALADARYIQDSQGQPQKLLLATRLFTINGEV